MSARPQRRQDLDDAHAASLILLAVLERVKADEVDARPAFVACLQGAVRALQAVSGRQG
ncbi:MAG: hypothetical protein JWM64_2072 [Frankiales bacterium]|nr:hypothetical protein [Frankiales bacterium]